MTDSVLIPGLPVYWRVRNGEDASGRVPERMPLLLGFNEELQLFQQRTSPELLRTLNDIYNADANVGYLQEENTLARPYFTDFYEYLQQLTGERGIRTAAEIGCGGCLVLEALQNDGLSVVGIDPSPVAAACGAKKKVTVIQEFFPPPKLEKEFDLIFHADVLEHMEDPVAFLNLHKRYLKPGGFVVVSVPDCEESIQVGDISMLIHQHLNYFDRTSLGRVAQAAGFEVVDLRAAGHGGSMYALLRATGGIPENDARGRRRERFDAFTRKFTANNQRFLAQISAATRDRVEDAAFYVPLRAFPYLAYNRLIDEDYRIFDDTPRWHRKHLDGYRRSVENLKDLADDPVKNVFVMSLIFDAVITSKIKSSVKAPVNVIKLRSIL